MNERWWTLTGGGELLSRRHVQAFVFPLPRLNSGELEAALRFKVQTILPVDTGKVPFQTRLFQNKGRSFGAAFVGEEALGELSIETARRLRVGFPLVLPRDWGLEALVFVASPEGIEAHLYHEGVFQMSFAPFPPSDQTLFRTILDRHSNLLAWGISIDESYLVPHWPGLEPVASRQRDSWFRSLPSWLGPRERRWPWILAILMLALGFVGLGVSALRELNEREHRNVQWSQWVRKVEATATVSQKQVAPAKLLQAVGLPFPDLFTHLAQVWRDGKTKIVSFDWTQGKLTLSARSAAALVSLRQLDTDSWFRGLHVDEIRAQKDGSELFTIEGELQYEP